MAVNAQDDVNRAARTKIRRDGCDGVSGRIRTHLAAFAGVQGIDVIFTSAPGAGSSSLSRHREVRYRSPTQIPG
jgi:hypothetical protein